VDVLFSTSASAPVLPANYTKKRRIGAARTDGSGNILPFLQIGEFFQAVAFPLVSGSISTSRSLFTVGPTGLKFVLRLAATIGGSGNLRGWVGSPDETDAAPSLTAVPLLTVTNVGSSSGTPATQITALSNASGQIAARSDVSQTLYLQLIGWTDRRGRDD
jgi:hypothetical protein